MTIQCKRIIALAAIVLAAVFLSCASFAEEIPPAAAPAPVTSLTAEAFPGAARPSAAALQQVTLEGQTREAFFANGTPIVIREPAADTGGWIHDAEVQAALGNNYSPVRKPGSGAVISWQEGEETRFVYVSGYCKVFGGSLNASVRADVQITVTGRDVRRTFPNLAYLFGGGCGGSVYGSVTIRLEESQAMYVYGGGYNGSVTGDVLISTVGTNWSRRITGGGLSSSAAEESTADVDGNVTLDLRGSMISQMDAIIGGGMAESVSAHAAQANVNGSVRICAEGRNACRIIGGGHAYRMVEKYGEPAAEIGGDISIELRDSSIRFSKTSKTLLKGGLVAGGWGCSGKAAVCGSIQLTVADTVFDNDTAGIVFGGMAEGKTASADVEGNAEAWIFPGCNPPCIIRGGLAENGGAAELKGDAVWHGSSGV